MPTRHTWLDPTICDPPHSVSRPEQVEALFEEFSQLGWDLLQPALVGYRLGDRVQLLSGSHRHAAALLARIEIPVVIYPLTTIQHAWGNLDWWVHLMASGDIETAAPNSGCHNSGS